MIPIRVARATVLVLCAGLPQLRAGIELSVAPSKKHPIIRTLGGMHRAMDLPPDPADVALSIRVTGDETLARIVQHINIDPGALPVWVDWIETQGGSQGGDAWRYHYFHLSRAGRFTLRRQDFTGLPTWLELPKLVLQRREDPSATPTPTSTAKPPAAPLPALPRSGEIKHGVSPSGRYELRAHEATHRRFMSYDVMDTDTGKLLLRIPSTYQPEEGESDEFAWKHTTDAELYWSNTSHWLFIDEQNHNYIGEVIVVALNGNRVWRVPLRDDFIQRKTGQKWDKHRIRVEEYHDNDTEITLGIAGTVLTDTPGKFINRRYTFRVTLRNGGIVSIGDFKQAE